MEKKPVSSNIHTLCILSGLCSRLAHFEGSPPLPTGRWQSVAGYSPPSAAEFRIPRTRMSTNLIGRHRTIEIKKAPFFGAFCPSPVLRLTTLEGHLVEAGGVEPPSE